MGYRGELLCKNGPLTRVCGESGSVVGVIQVVTPPTRVRSEGGVQGSDAGKNGPPTRVCSEGGSVYVHGKINDPTDSRLERGWGPRARCW